MHNYSLSRLHMYSFCVSFVYFFNSTVCLELLWQVSMSSQALYRFADLLMVSRHADANVRFCLELQTGAAGMRVAGILIYDGEKCHPHSPRSCSLTMSCMMV